jgi:hypothetical protein
MIFITKISLVLRLKSGNFQDLDLPTFLLNYVTETNYLASFIKKCLLLSVAKGSIPQPHFFKNWRTPPKKEKKNVSLYNVYHFIL